MTRRSLPLLCLLVGISCSTQAPIETPTPSTSAPDGARGSSPAGAAPTADAPCGKLSVERAVNDSGFLSDRYRWFDGDCQPRSALMVRNTQKDAVGLGGGYLRTYTYLVDGAERACSSPNSSFPGFGLIVNHTQTEAVNSKDFTGDTQIVFAGAHHAIHQYQWHYPISGQPVTITVQWLFATGRDNPLWTITYDLTAAAPDAVQADTRSPYGVLDWDGGTGAEVSGVAWGDRYKFHSLESPISMQSGWDYTEANTVPYALGWTNQPDAEMGIVQTQTFAQHDAGGYWFYPSWGTRNTAGPMPANWNWPFQLDQYDLPGDDRSKRVAWGSNFGAVGARSYPVFGNDGTAVGYPYQSYSVHLVLGRHSDSAVARQVAEVEAVQRTTLTAVVGQVLTSGAAGIGRPDQVGFSPAGYNHVYGSWDIAAQANRVDATFKVASGSLEKPLVVIHGWAGGDLPSNVSVGDRTLTADVDYFASLDTDHHDLWLTLPFTLTGSTRLRVQ